MALLPPDPLFVLRSDMGHIHSLEFMFSENNATHLLAATEEGYIYFWNLQTNKVTNKQRLGVSIQTIHYMLPYIITQEKSGHVQLWHVETNFTCTLLKEYYCKGDYCRSIIINSCLILPEVNSKVESVDLHTFETVTVFVPLKERLGNITALEKANVVGKICVLTGYESEHITSIAFDSVIGRGVCGNSSNQLKVFTIDKEHNIKLKCEISIKNAGCNVVRLRPDRKILACGGWDGNLRLFSWKSLRLLVGLNQHNNSVTDVIFSGQIVPEWNSNIMSVAGGDGSISLWNLYNH
ncbi:hypothetical protein RI129_012062 [Pyrocoelia pectoralis]|uniref:Guanine nucleotide-binding protein subunit beta-like protein 1 n=1 Tax=Pyrocoelia pectoralis TaxID=417401 RepID=A0AAN7UYD6_9COLE